MSIDPSIYDAPEFDNLSSDTGSTPGTQYVAPENVSQGQVLQGTMGQGMALTQQAEANRTKATALQSAGATVSEWSVRSAYDFLTTPAAQPQAGFNLGDKLVGLGMTLEEEERAFLSKAVSDTDWQNKLAVVERRRFAARASADSPFMSFVAGMFDPKDLLIDVASLGAGRLARIAYKAGKGVQTTAVGATAMAGTVGFGMLEREVRPVSDTEIVLDTLINGAAASVFYRAGLGFRRTDPEFPSELLTSLANKNTAVNPDMRGAQVPHKFTTNAADVNSFRTGRELVDHLRPQFAGTAFAEVLESVARYADLDKIRVTTHADYQKVSPNASGYWAQKDQLLFLKPDSGRDVALHELVHATVEKRMLADPKLRAELLQMRDSVVALLGNKRSKDAAFWREVMKKPEEFVTYALTSPQFRKWAEKERIGASGQVDNAADMVAPAMPNELPTMTVWDKVVEFVAKALGMEGPRARALKQYMQDRRIAEDPANAKLKTFDDRMREMMRAVSNLPDKPNLYTRGTLKDVPATIGEIELRQKLDKLGSKEYVGSRISWSLHKSMASFGTVGRRIADLLVDNPLDMRGDSVVSQARAVRADFTSLQFEYEDLLSKELAARGAGVFQRIGNTRKGIEVQQGIEKELQLEMLHRERNTRLGRATPSKSKPVIVAMADKLDNLYRTALKEMQAAGVRGADAVAESSGYFSRRWDISNITEAKNKLIAMGRTPEEADNLLIGMVQSGLRQANGWDAELSRDVAKAILDRADRKGFFEDSAFRHHVGNEAAKEVRDILKEAGISGKRLQRAMDVLTGVVDEAGKLSNLKRRLDIEMKAGIALPDGSVLTVADLIASDITRGTEAYLDQVAGRIALARKGLPDVSDAGALRDELSRSIPTVAERGEAVKLFDETMNSIMGRPTGEDLPAAMRNLQAVTRMVGLASSGLWQLTEYAVVMARFGGIRTLKYAMKEASFAAVRRADYKTSQQLVDVLSRNASIDIRIRPFINRMEDNFDVPMSNVVQAKLMQAQQLVPYINAQKYVQTHQARVVANLVVDTFSRAGKGDQKAIEVLAGYGLEPHIMTRIQAELADAGMDTAKWSDSTWAAVRGPLTKMMDDSVLRNRTGEIPAFAQFSQVGKFIFTFRSFVLGAHNKVLAGTISRDGIAGLGLIVLYQFPMSLLAVQANAAIQGKEIKDDEELVAKAFGQMGSIGLFSELFGVATGQKEQFGAPGMIAIDRAYKLVGDVASGDTGQALSGALQAVPLISIFPTIRAVGEAFKEADKE